MEPAAIKRILIGTIIYLMAFDSLYGQTTSVSNKMFQRTFAQKNKLDPFYYLGDKIKKRNTHCYVILENDLVKNVPIPDYIFCKNNFGIFAYRVNSKGIIDHIEYSGDLDTMIVHKIKYNIALTHGLYTLPSPKSKNVFHWFLLPFFSNGKQWDFYECQDEEKLKSEFQAKFKQHQIYLNLLKMLPQFSGITILHDMDHLPELITEGRVKY